MSSIKKIQYFHEIEEWLKHLPRQIEWNAERLPAITQKLFFSLLKSERRKCPADLREQILTNQECKCTICGESLKDITVEWDHVIPLQQVVKGAEIHWQAICSPCHNEKTSLEGKQDRTLTSRFSKTVWENYVLSARPPAICYRPHSWGEDLPEKAAEIIEIDVKRCRRNALSFASHDFSVFCPLDNVEVSTQCELGDFSFVDVKPGKRSALNLLPWSGPA